MQLPPPAADACRRRPLGASPFPPAPCSKRALAATSKAWHAAAWEAQDAVGGHRVYVYLAVEGPGAVVRLQSLLDFLQRRRPRVAVLSLALDHGDWHDQRVFSIARSLLTALFNQPFKLELSSHEGADLMPRLPLLTDAKLDLRGRFGTAAERERRAAEHWHAYLQVLGFTASSGAC